MKKFSGIFPSLYLALKKREQALQEFGRCTAKVQKYEDKERSGQNLAKLEAVSLIIMLITDTVSPIHDGASCIKMICTHLFSNIDETIAKQSISFFWSVVQ